MAAHPRQRHRSFLLRLWQAGNGDAPEWRISLEDTRTGERHGFMDLASLLAFLETCIEDERSAMAHSFQGGSPMSNAADLGQGKWRLHVITNQAVAGPGYMGTPEKNGVNTDVVLTFPSSESAPETSSPVPFAVAWRRAVIQPEDEYDDEAHRGTYWARFIPAAIEDHVLVQIAQVGYPTTGASPQTIRLFSGRLQTRSPLMFFGHGAGNDNNPNLSFTLTQE